MKKILNMIEKEMIRVVIRENRPLTINEISTISGISWITVKKYSSILVKKNVFNEINILKIPKYGLNSSLIEIIAERKNNNKDD